MFCKSAGENIDHLFPHCFFPSFILHQIFQVFQIQGAIPKEWKKWIGLVLGIKKGLELFGGVLLWLQFGQYGLKEMEGF